MYIKALPNTTELPNGSVGSFSYENFVVVWGFMRHALKLKSYELFIYAIIFGYYRNYCSPFTGSRKYLAEWTGASRATVETALASLEKSNLIKKEYVMFDNIKKAVYSINTEALPDCQMFELENRNRDNNEKIRQAQRSN
jgi:hypothetical protein